MTWAFILDSVPFTKAVIAGETSLGGSESACLGLARALQARGHQIHVFTTQLAQDAANQPDHAGATWHSLDEFTVMNQFIEWDVVVSLRMFAAYAWRPVYARMRLLWNQDLLVPGAMQAGVMSVAWALDHLCYVSEYHRKQWEQLQPELKGLGWVTRNGFDPADLPTGPITKDPNRIIHISRPERGLGPALAMWPLLKAKRPQATLQVCRYSSMYDQGPGSWTDVCQRWDDRIKDVNAEVGGIEFLGELNKKQLYKAVSEAAVMWYPGVATFAETNCIAALEAEACGTPFVGSYRGALPETSPTGILIKGDAEHDASYHQQSVSAVVEMLEQCQQQTFDYRRRQKEGRAHAQQCTYATLAAEWETQVLAWFRVRYEGNKSGVLRQLMHEDDHVAAKIVAEDIKTIELKNHRAIDGVNSSTHMLPVYKEAHEAANFCNYVIAGKDQGAENYAQFAVQDPLKEAEFSGRFHAVAPYFKDATRVLDVACGNGSFAIVLAQAYPDIRVHGLDYAAGNIERARDAAERAGVADRCTFEQCTVFDFDAQALHADWRNFIARINNDLKPLTLDRPYAGWFDGMFVGEFIEHVGNYRALIDGLETVLTDGAQVVYTCPHGACIELMPRDVPVRKGHVHRFHQDDVNAVWGPKAHFATVIVYGGMTERGNPIGNWIISYQTAPNRPAGERPLRERIERTRPFQRLSVGIITKDAENDIGRCLNSIYRVADEIVVADTGSGDKTKAIVASYGPKVRLVELDPIDQQPHGFAGARNAVLKQCVGEWFLWIDSDEQLINPHWLRRYLDGSVFNGYVIHQTHLYIDGPPTFDIPVRVFRNTGQVQFYGCVHEQPQHGDANTDIYPTLDVADLQIAHTGYLTQEGREDKRVTRNLPLLLRDQKVFPDRVLGQVLLLREAVIQADMERSHVRGQMTPRAQQGYAHALRIFLEHFDDPAHKYHTLARPWYEAALKHLGLGWEQEIALAGCQGPMEHRHARPDRVWVRDGDEYRRILAHKVEDVVKKMQPVRFVTDPDDLAPKVRQEAEDVMGVAI